jgi:hypothetical protein
LSTDRAERVNVEGFGFLKDFFVEGKSDLRGGAFNNVFDSAFFGKVKVILLTIFKHLK